MCRRFLLLLSITYTHILYLCGTPRCLKYWVHIQTKDMIWGIINVWSTNDARQTYICAGDINKALTRCVSNRNSVLMLSLWRIVSGKCLTPLWINTQVKQKCSDELLSGGHLDSCRDVLLKHSCLFAGFTASALIGEMLFPDRSVLDWMLLSLRLGKGLSNRRWCMLAAENRAALCFNWVLYRKATVLENSDGSDGEDGQHPSLFC